MDKCITEEKELADAPVDITTDGYQFGQNLNGDHPKEMYVLDSVVIRPVKIVQTDPQSDVKRGKDWGASTYKLTFDTKVPNIQNLVISDTIDLTPFLQIDSVLTQPEVVLNGVTMPTIKYNHDDEIKGTEYGLLGNDSCYLVDKEWRVTVEMMRQMMVSMVIKPDELYLGKGDTTPILIPYYSFYEHMIADKKDLVSKGKSFEKDKEISEVIQIIFCCIGGIALAGGLALFLLTLYLPKQYLLEDSEDREKKGTKGKEENKEKGDLAEAMLKDNQPNENQEEDDEGINRGDAPQTAAANADAKGGK